MHSKFINTKASCARAVKYVLTGHDNEPNIEVTTLRGDPHQVASVADALSFKNKYSSQVLAFSKDDKVTDDQVAEVTDAFIAHANPGLEPDQYAVFAVQHRKENGAVDVHIIQAKVELRTGSAMNVAPPGHIEYFDPVRDMFNEKYGWKSPDIENHPDMKRTISLANPAWQSEFANKRKELASQLDSYISSGVENGLIQSRADVIEYLNEAGVNIIKTSANFITIKTADMEKGMRLKGEFFNEDFTIDKMLAAQGRVGDVRSERLDGRTYEQLREDVSKVAEKRNEYNLERYSKSDSRSELANERTHELAQEKMVADNHRPSLSFVDDLRRELGIRELSTQSNNEAGNREKIDAEQNQRAVKTTRKSAIEEPATNSNSPVRWSNLRENKNGQRAEIRRRLDADRPKNKVAKIVENITKLAKRSLTNDRNRDPISQAVERAKQSVRRANEQARNLSKSAKQGYQHFSESANRSVDKLRDILRKTEPIVEDIAQKVAMINQQFADQQAAADRAKEMRERVKAQAQEKELSRGMSRGMSM